jgi:hypothetical protein
MGGSWDLAFFSGQGGPGMGWGLLSQRPSHRGRALVARSFSALLIESLLSGWVGFYNTKVGLPGV